MTSFKDFSETNDIDWFPIDLILSRDTKDRTKIKKTISPKCSKEFKTSDFNPENPISPEELKRRQREYPDYEYIAIDTWNITQIDIDNPEILELPEIQELLKTAPHFLSCGKGLPHIFVKQSTQLTNKAQKIGCKGKFDGIDILQGQWSWMKKDAVIINADKPIPEISLQFMVEKKKESVKKESVKKESLKPQTTLNEMTESTPVENSFLQGILNCISPSRAHDYHQWMSVGYALFNIDESNLELWISFSKQSSKFKEGECARIWSKLEKGQSTIGTLKWYAKQDSPEEYSAFVNNSLESKIDRAISSKGTHCDIADCVYEFFNGEYVFSNKSWFHYDTERHRWIKTEQPCILRKNLNLIGNQFSIRSAYWTNQSVHTEDEDLSEKFLNKAQRALKITLDLKDASFRDSIMKECKTLFTDDEGKFDLDLDSIGSLIGFTNGVYDIKSHEFRDGRPDDFISKTTGYKFVNTFDPEVKNKIENLLTITFPDADDRKMYLDMMSMSLDGTISKEDFFIHTGNGGNGKGMMKLLMSLVFGQLYASIDASILTIEKKSRSGAEPEIARLKGVRYVVAVEPPENATFQMDTIKKFTGGDNISSRELYKGVVEYRPMFSCNCECNVTPDIANITDAEVRRITVLLYLVKFCQFPDPNNPYEKPLDITLKKLFQENIEYRQCMMFMLIENYKTIQGTILKKSPNSIISTKRYLQGTDLIQNWFEECMVRCEKITTTKNGKKEEKNAFTPSSQLYPNFVDYCRRNGAKNVPTARNFKPDFIKKIGIPETKYNVMGFKGIIFKQDESGNESE